MSLASDFRRLFDGLQRSHGRYVVPSGGKPSKGKLHDRKWAATVHAPLTEDLYADHLAGRVGLGVVPVRDDATCSFGAVDIDPHDDSGNYTQVDVQWLLSTIKEYRLPVIACRTKSGGAHLYLFLTSPTSADLVRGKLMEWAVALGDPDAEVFPKQTRLASAKDDGSWINLPYFGGSLSTRYAFKPDGTSMTPEEFVVAADAMAVTPDDLKAFQLPSDPAGSDLWIGAPPCLQTLAVRGFGEWQNNGLFNVAVYLRKRYGDAWKERLDAYNQQLMSPPVGHTDVASIAKSVSKKTYSYMCKQQPICGVCNRSVCLTREFGVGGLGDDPGVVIGELVKIETDPPTYIMDVNGARLEIDLDDLIDQRRFKKVVLAKLDILTSMIRQPTWDEMIRTRLGRMERIKVPGDATKEGQFWLHVQSFCTSKVAGRTMDEILLKKPFTDPQAKRTYFRSADLIQYLAQNKFMGITERDVWGWLRKRDADHHFATLKGKGVNYWSIPAFGEQTEDHDVPRQAPQERF